MMRMQKIPMAIALLLVFVNHFNAQHLYQINDSDVDTTRMTILTLDDVQVFKSFEATLGEAKRIIIRPAIPQNESKKYSYRYQISHIPDDIVYPEPTIKPLATQVEDHEKGHSFYTKLGYGMLKSTYVDIGYFGLNNLANKWIIDGKFRKMDNSTNVANQKYSKSSLSITKEFLLGENHVFSVGLRGNHDRVNLYDTLVVPSIDNTARNFTNIGIHAKIENSTMEKHDFKYDFGISTNILDIQDSYSLYADTSGVSELGIGLQGNVWKKIGSATAFYFKTTINLQSFRLRENAKQTLKTAIFQPGISFRFNKLQFDISGDFFVDNNKFIPFLDLEVSLLFSDFLQLYIGTDLEVINHTLHNSYFRNNFISIYDLSIRNSTKHRYYLGLRGRISDRILFSSSLGYENIDGQYYYTQNDMSNPTLSINFIELKAINFEGDLEFMISSGAKIGGRVSKLFYDIKDDISLQNIASFRLETYAKFTFLNGLFVVQPVLKIRENIEYRLPSNSTEIDGNSMKMLNIQTDIRISKYTSLWFKANNLLNNKYLWYQDHPTEGIYITGGIVIKI